jgi:hypothetical protein
VRYKYLDWGAVDQRRLGSTEPGRFVGKGTVPSFAVVEDKPTEGLVELADGRKLGD